jgi:multidrug efflux pump subunit AcrA (membrane-fusion protein)
MASIQTSRANYVLTTILLGSFAFWLLGCKKAEESPAPEVTVQAVHPRTGSISEQITADATLAPFAQANLSPKVTAPVQKFYVQRGSIVKVGQLLATLENKDLEAAALDNKGAYTSAQAVYETATRATAPEDYTKAQLDLTQAKGALELNQSIVSARSQLFAQGAIPGRDLDTANASLVQSQAAYDIAKQHLEAVQQVSHKATLKNAQGQLASAEGKYLGAQAQLSYTEIRSPINGVVTDRPLFEGETAGAGTPVITIMDTSALLAKLHISQIQAQQLTQGAPAEITIPGITAPIAAKVSLISPALDSGSTTVEVWLRVENPKRFFKAGTAVHAVITGRSISNALLIPSEAIQTATDGTTKSLMVIAANGSARKRPVVLGIQTPENTQVLSGITTGDTVITTGAYGLDDGTKVKIGAAAVDKPDTTVVDTKPGAGKKDDQ